MQNLSKPSKIFLFITVLFFALSLGGYVLRQVVVYQFFEPENLSLRIIYSAQNLPVILFTALPVFVFNIALSGALELRKTKSPFSIGEIVKAELS